MAENMARQHYTVVFISDPRRKVDVSADDRLAIDLAKIQVKEDQLIRIFLNVRGIARISGRA